MGATALLTWLSLVEENSRTVYDSYISSCPSHQCSILWPLERSSDHGKTSSAAGKEEGRTPAGRTPYDLPPFANQRIAESESKRIPKKKKKRSAIERIYIPVLLL